MASGFAETVGTSVGSVHRDIQNAIVPVGTVGGQELPATIKGKDNKVRKARKPTGRKRPKPNGKGNDQDEPAKGERPTITELVQIMCRGLAVAKEVEGLDPKKNSIFFRVNGYKVKVTCRIV